MIEEFRILKAGLQVKGLGNNLHTLLITSSGPKEGKSLITAHLALALAESGRKVMIVDANLRDPVQHKIWNINNAFQGLTSVLQREINDPAEVVQETINRNLLVVPTGYLPPDPGKVLVSESLSPFIDEMKKQAEIILFDTPPLLTSSDAALLSTKTDGVLLVIAAGMYKRKTVKKAVGLLGSLEVPILGTVLNMADSLDTVS
ncbi:MAG: CpsD/CapB family tyrosine-protein kinase [Bacillota bacterium]|jgi:protein-tyrosine kinase